MSFPVEFPSLFQKEILNFMLIIPLALFPSTVFSAFCLLARLLILADTFAVGRILDQTSQFLMFLDDKFWQEKYYTGLPPPMTTLSNMDCGCHGCI